MKALTDAIWGKCTSATDLYADIGGRLFKGRAPQGAEFPYVVFFVVTDNPDNAFAKDGDEAIVQFSVFSKTAGNAEAENIVAHLRALYDDVALTITGHTLIGFAWQNTVPMADEIITPDGTVEAWHYAVDYLATRQES